MLRTTKCDAFSEARRTKNRLLRYGIRIRCSKRLPGVRDAFSEAFGVKNRLFRYGRDIRCMKTPFFCTEGVFRGTRCSKQASTVRKRYSVPKTASSGTRRIFKGPQNSRLHRLWTASRRSGRRFSARNGPRSLCSLRPLPLLLRRHSVPETPTARR